MVSKISKIEGVNSETMSKLKATEQKLLAKAKAKMPNASDVIIKMSPTLVNAKSGKFYRGGLYATEDGRKWVKCAEVRVREGKEGAAPKPAAAAKPTEKPAKPVDTPKLTKEDLKRRKENEKSLQVEKKTEAHLRAYAKELESDKNRILESYAAKTIFATAEPKILRTLFKPAVMKSLKVNFSSKPRSNGGSEIAFDIDITIHLPFSEPNGEEILKEHGLNAQALRPRGFFHLFYSRMLDIGEHLDKGHTGLSKKYVNPRAFHGGGLDNPWDAKFSGNGVDVRFSARSFAYIHKWA